MKKVIILYTSSRKVIDVVEVVELSEEKLSEIKTKVEENKKQEKEKVNQQLQREREEKLALEERLKNLEKEIAYLKGE